MNNTLSAKRFSNSVKVDTDKTISRLENTLAGLNDKKPLSISRLEKDLDDYSKEILDVNTVNFEIEYYNRQIVVVKNEFSDLEFYQVLHELISGLKQNLPDIDRKYVCVDKKKRLQIQYNKSTKFVEVIDSDLSYLELVAVLRVLSSAIKINISVIKDED